MLSWLFRGLTLTRSPDTGPSYASSSPPSQSSDTASPLYPDRPIRPLPKRRLRSRLSEDVAESILAPPRPPSAAPLFYFPPYNITDGRNTSEDQGSSVQSNRIDLVDSTRGSQQQEELAGERGAVRTYVGGSYEKDGGASYQRYAGQSESVILDSQQQHRHNKVNTSKINAKPPPPPSATSSVDGYDSFENTNNKKKRKIPTPGNSSGHHSHLSADLANLGISSGDPATVPSDDLGAGVGQYYGTGSSASSLSGTTTGTSGAGRGRLGRGSGRSASVRSPLGVTTDGMNAWANGRTRYRTTPPARGALAVGQESLDKPGAEQGIISAAIAGAAENALPPSHGQENVSLLQQKTSRKTTPTKTQFTFTSPVSVNWPGGSSMAGSTPLMSSPGGSLPSGTPQNHFSRDVTTQGTQTSPKAVGPGRHQQALPTAQHGSANRQAYQQPLSANQQGTQQPKKPRPRRTGKEYALAARQRRLQQEYNNYHHPPSSDEVWICEFCEYESIFGAPPEALVRQYEIKDRRERRRLAEKRRLLEKAKLKGRKGKKGNKAGAKNAAATAQQNQQAVGDQSAVDNQGMQSDEYGADDYDDESAAAPVSQATPKPSYSQPSQVKPAQAHAASGDNGVKGGGGRASQAT
ncbi:MAG: hypothetical protein M1833_001678 [Piccolia ochrophora]|nr:MAG: hypothetical protein M1833_001678 [Piccolia ochrophora]